MPLCTRDGGAEAKDVPYGLTRREKDEDGVVLSVKRTLRVVERVRSGVTALLRSGYIEVVSRRCVGEGVWTTLVVSAADERSMVRERETLWVYNNVRNASEKAAPSL